MDDLISRQAAVDAIEKMNIPEDMCVFEILSHIEVEIATLPTIQSQSTMGQLNDGARSTDLIDRQQAIDACMKYNGHGSVWACIMEDIKMLPPAQPEPHYDEWCDTCKEYDHERHCCPRWNHVIRTALQDAKPEPHWIPVSDRVPSKEERKEWIDNNLDGIGYLYPCLVTRYSSINPDRTKNNPYVAKHYYDGEDFLNAGEEVCSEYIIAWMPLPKIYKPNNK